jgi:hypothetical protein
MNFDTAFRRDEAIIYDYEHAATWDTHKKIRGTAETLKQHTCIGFLLLTRYNNERTRDGVFIPFRFSVQAFRE